MRDKSIMDMDSCKPSVTHAEQTTLIYDKCYQHLNKSISVFRKRHIICVHQSSNQITMKVQ